jgi:hypothetical protein
VRLLLLVLFLPALAHGTCKSDRDCVPGCDRDFKNTVCIMPGCQVRCLPRKELAARPGAHKLCPKPQLPLSCTCHEKECIAGPAPKKDP